MSTLFDEPVIVADPRKPDELRSLPPTLAGFVLLGPVVSALRFGGVCAVAAEIVAEQKRSGVDYWTFAQYDRFFAAASTPEAKYKPFLLGIIALKRRYSAARAAGTSAWEFHLAEDRRKQAEREAEVGRDAISAAAIERSREMAHRRKVAEYEADYRARREARENVDRERPPRSKRTEREPSYPTPAYTPAEREPADYIAPTTTASALVPVEAVVVEGEYESEFEYPVEELF